MLERSWQVRQRELFLEWQLGRSPVCTTAWCVNPPRSIAVGLPRTTAAFHLDRLVEEDLLDVIYQRRTGQ